MPKFNFLKLSGLPVSEFWYAELVDDDVVPKFDGISRKNYHDTPHFPRPATSKKVLS